ncbi:Protein phosphatase 1 regulatory subunit 3D [Oryzias melastigma]|uniref:Protein phosphatase 1 regulatory subunit 3D n=1 Tax=Oryzias melastigma TaxID=30732 RepID=A0A834FBY0_ORYME|nr:protein phosphatase 1, regulatory subunit 3Db [Oryzias melastigma]KAF6728566.1 Protein phosphatase 1 regulatory subunit 3D [Oryzias melastigma]
MAGVAGGMGGSGGTVTTIRLRDIYDPKPQPPKAPVRIRPPPPQHPSPLESKPSFSSDIPTKTSMRRRAQSLPGGSERRTELRRAQVRFIDALGLDLEEIKVFRVQERPLVPEHVIFRLLMNSERAFGKPPELNLPYFKACFPENMAALPEFPQKLVSQKVCLEQLTCSDHGITGTIRVLNLAFEKEVKVLYSFTNWRTHTDTTACWVMRGHQGDSVSSLDTDVFRFHLPVPPFILQPGAVLEFAIRYHVIGHDYWDNNNGGNYKLSCHSFKVTVPKECEDSLLHFT